MKKSIKAIILSLTVILTLVCFVFVNDVIDKKTYNTENVQIITKEEDADKEEIVPNWVKDSKAMKSIIAFVKSVTDKNSIEYIPVEQRIVVFDFDGTLYGEHFPTYFDQSMLIYRLLYDKNYQATEEQKEYAKALEMVYFDNQPWPESTKTVEQIAAESFEGFTVEEYREYVHEFMTFQVTGFDNMTYKDGFYLPMISLIKYLSDNEFTIFISSGSECDLVREVTEGTLDKWIPPYRVIGSTFSLAATEQGNVIGEEYTYTKDDKVLIEGKDVTFRNLKMNKVISIIDEIGAVPIMAFGNSTGDFSMAQYVLQHGGKVYMLLSDDEKRDYGNQKEASLFEKQCSELGFETISIKDEFETIYNKDVKKTEMRRIR